jgi:hypothetical protein
MKLCSLILFITCHYRKCMFYSLMLMCFIPRMRYFICSWSVMRRSGKSLHAFLRWFSIKASVSTRLSRLQVLALKNHAEAQLYKMFFLACAGLSVTSKIYSLNDMNQYVNGYSAPPLTSAAPWRHPLFPVVLEYF